MIKGLQAKLMLILVLLTVISMAVVGIVLVNSVSSLYRDNFKLEVSSVFTSVLITDLQDAATEANPEESIYTALDTYSGRLGINSYRNIYLLSENGTYLKGSELQLDASLVKTPNLVLAMGGEIGDKSQQTQSFMDYALPLLTASGNYIIYIKDSMAESNALAGNMVVIITQTLLLAVIIAFILSFFLAKTITRPVEELTSGAKRIADGDFSHSLSASSGDEIGTLTETFNNMASVLASTLDSVQGERNKLKTIFEYMSDGVAAFGGDGVLMHINNAAGTLGEGFTEDVSTFEDVFYPLVEMSFYDIYGKTADGHLEIDINRGGRIYKCSFARFGTSTQGGVIAVLHDVTEQERINQSRREFIANVSHELRTPLTNVKSYTETVLDNGDLPEETRTKFLSVVVNEADRMIRIVKDLLVLSRLDNKKMDLHMEPFDLPPVLSRVYDAMLIEAQKRGQTLSLETVDGIPPINGDKERVEQVFVNIVSNAIKYTPDGGSIAMNCNIGLQNVTVRIIDNGIGIPAEDLPRIFERFYRVDKARSREMGGTGLGLAIAKELIEAHGGSIEIKSKLGKGTTVLVMLPIA